MKSVKVLQSIQGTIFYILIGSEDVLDAAFTYSSYDKYYGEGGLSDQHVITLIDEEKSDEE